jgi:hypothetical protein
METLGLLGAAAAFFSVGFALVLYELSRIKAGRPILKAALRRRVTTSSIW